MSTSSSASLKRGEACTSCRRRKVKCSGTRPVCNQCMRLGIQVDCEYKSYARMSHTEVLELEIQRLRSRLDDAAAHTPSVMTDVPSFESSPADYSMSSMSEGSPEKDVTPPPTAIPYEEVETWWEGDRPSQEHIQKAIDDLGTHARWLGFFLDPAEEFRSPDSPDKTLFWNTFMLWAIHLSRTVNHTVHEPTICKLVLGQLNDAIGKLTPANFLYVLQAEVVLAYYCVRNASWQQARYHASAAATLALDHQLHEPPRCSTPLAELQYQGRSYLELKDHVDPKPRRKAFYYVCFLDKCLSVLSGTRSVLMLEDTVWLLADYDEWLPNDVFALGAHVAIALHRASTLCTTNNTDIDAIQDQDRVSNSLLAAVDKLCTGEPPVPDARFYLTYKMLLLLSRIYLRLPFEDTNPSARSEVVELLAEFCTTASEVDMPSLKIFNPMMSNFWVATCHLMRKEMQCEEDHGRSLSARSKLTEGLNYLLQSLIALSPEVPLKSFREKLEALMPLMGQI